MRLRYVLMWLAGIDLRLTILAVPPVLPLIHHDLRLNETGVAALTNLPVLTLAGSSVFGSLLVRRLGARGALVLGLWTIALASSVRGFGPSLPLLFGASFVMGLGIALIQPAFPTLARQWFPARVSLATAFWSNGLLVGEALSAALTLPLVLPFVGGSWGDSFIVWGVFVALTALGVGLFGGGADAPRSAPNAKWFPNFREPRVWQLGLLQSSASLTYFGANTFMPDYLHATGRPELIAACLAALNVGQLPASIALGFMPVRLHARKLPSYAVATLLLAALAVFLRGDGIWLVAAAALVGFCGAYVMVLSFTVPALIAPGGEVARLSSGMFTLAYAISFATSLASGAAWDATHVPAVAFLPTAAAAIIVLVVGPRIGATAARAVDA